MSNIIVKEVKTKKEIKDFILFPTKLFKGVHNYVPCMYGDELKVLNRKTTYEKESKTEFYIAYIDNKVVGRIQVLVQYTYNKKANAKQARFTRFDCINDYEVAKALFDKAIAWAKEQGMDTIVGPLDYSDLEREGLLIEGFDEYMTFEEQYHPSYYQGLIEQYGFTKDVDWLEFELRFNEDTAARLDKIAKAVTRFAKVKLAPIERKDKYIKKYKRDVFNLIEVCYGKLYGTMPLSDETIDSIIDQFLFVIDPEFLPVAVNEHNEVIGFALCVPSISPVLAGTDGKLTLPRLLKLLKTIKNPKCLELLLVAVRPDYQKLGVNALFLSNITKTIKRRNIEFAETNLNLETNEAVMAQWKQFNARHHKRRRCFKLELQ